MTKGKQPLPLFVGDFLASTAPWDGDVAGVYALLLMHQWASGPLPSDPNDIRKMCRIHAKKWYYLWPKIAPKFEATPAGLINRRLEEHRQAVDQLREKRSQGGKNGMAKRWKGDNSAITLDETVHIRASSPAPRDGGTGEGTEHASRPIANDSHPNAGEETDPRQPETDFQLTFTSEKPKTPVKTRKAEELPDYPPELDREAWHKWANYRMAIKKPIRPASYSLAMRNMCALGADQMACVDQSIANSWQGLFALKSAAMSSSRGKLTLAEAEQQLRQWEREQGGG